MTPAETVHTRRDTQSTSDGLAGPSSPDTGQGTCDTQISVAGSGAPSPAKTVRCYPDTHSNREALAGLSSPDTGHGSDATQISVAGSGAPSPAKTVHRQTVPHEGLDGLAGTLSPNQPIQGSEPKRPAVDWAAFDELRVYAECLADSMDHRIALANRVRSGTVPADVTAEIRASHDHVEKLLRKGMVKAFRRAAPEIADWTRETVGLGEETMARLLGRIGHPVVARPHHWEGDGKERQLVADDPFERTVSQLWSYCGHGDPARRRKKGMTADEAFALGSPHAKKLVYLLAVNCMKCAGGGAKGEPEPDGAPPLTPAENATDDAKADPKPKRAARRRSPYRDVYDIRRIVTAERDDWTLGHRNADALRLTGKAILRDLWVVARNAMEEPS